MCVGDEKKWRRDSQSNGHQCNLHDNAPMAYFILGPPMGAPGV
jgi:hypothetical protein